MLRPERNIKTGLYEVTENNIKYSFPFELLQGFKKYYGKSGNTTGWENCAKNWFYESPFDNKKMIQRERIKPSHVDIFYPD